MPNLIKPLNYYDMSLFCGPACRCRQRARGLFPGMPDLERGYANACKVAGQLSKEEYLCSGKYADERMVMLAYGYDPCAGTGPSFDELLDPTGSAEREQQTLDKLRPVFLVLAVAVVIGLLALWAFAKRK
jgi:hypothetical protein